jgi:hypothetical protein
LVPDRSVASGEEQRSIRSASRQLVQNSPSFWSFGSSLLATRVPSHSLSWPSVMRSASTSSPIVFGAFRTDRIDCFAASYRSSAGFLSAGDGRRCRCCEGYRDLRRLGHRFCRQDHRCRPGPRAMDWRIRRWVVVSHERQLGWQRRCPALSTVRLPTPRPGRPHPRGLAKGMRLCLAER